MSTRDENARAQRVWLDRQEAVREAEADVARATERLGHAREALKESEDALFPEGNDQND